MLGLRYRTEKGEKVVWLNQYEWLLHQRLVEWDDHLAWGLDERNIGDKSNADNSMKVAAFI
jgi:hypothetical protein